MFKCTTTNEEAETYTEYLQTIHWKSITTQMYETYRYQCSCCRHSTKLQIHHLTYERIGHENLTDLVYLCKACHRLYHEKPELFEGLVLENTLRGSKNQKNKPSLFTPRELNQYEVWKIENDKIVSYSNERKKIKREQKIGCYKNN